MFLKIIARNALNGNIDLDFLLSATSTIYFAHYETVSL